MKKQKKDRLKKQKSNGKKSPNSSSKVWYKGKKGNSTSLQTQINNVANEVNPVLTTDLATLSTTSSNAESSLSTATSGLSTTSSNAESSLSTATSDLSTTSSNAESSLSTALSTANSEIDSLSTALFNTNMDLVFLPSTEIGVVGGLSGADNTMTGYDDDPIIAGDPATNGSNAIGSITYGGNALYAGNPNSIFTITRPSWIDGTANSAATGKGWTMVGGRGADTILGNSNADSISGGNGNDSIIGNGGADTIIAGNGADIIDFANAPELALAASVVGGIGNDTISITTAGSVVDTDLTNVDGVEVLALTGASTFTGGVEAGGSGLASVFGGTTTQFTIASDYGTGTVELIGSTGVDTFEVDRASGTTNIRTGADGGLDVLASSSSVDLLGGSTGVVVLSGVLDSVLLTGTGDIDAIGNNNSNTITGNSGANSITGNLGGDSMLGNAGNDTFVGSINNDTILGGDDNDSIVGGGGTDSILGGNGDDMIVFATAFTMAAAATVAGGAGTDTVALTMDAQNIGNSDFGGLDSINVLELADGANIVDAGATAVTAGIATIVGGSGNDSLQVATMTSFTSLIGGAGTDTVALTTNGENIADADFGGFDSISVLELADGANIVDAGATAVTAGIATIVGGIGNDSLQVATMTSFTSLIGGAGTDTVALTTDAQNIGDSDFGGFDSINVLELADGLNVVDAGATALTAGIATIVGGSGDDSLYAANSSQGFYLSGGSAGNDTFVGSAFNDTIRGNGGIDSIETGNGDNLVIFATSGELSSAATVAGGAGDDTLSFTTPGQALIDGDFIHVDNVEAIQFADGTGSSAVLAGTANTAGIASLFGGTGNDSLTVDSTIYTAPTFVGSTGTDVLSLSDDGVTLNNTFFANLNSVEAFITANGNNDITVGNNGILSITGGTGNDNLNAAARTTGVTLLGGLGADTLTGGSGGSRQQGWGGISTANVFEDTLTGGAGTDVFVLGSAAGNAYGIDSNPALNKNAEITGFAMTTDIFELSLNGQSGSVTVAADSVIANQVNVSVGGLEVYRVNYDDATDAATLYISGTTNVVAQLTGFTGSGANLSTSNFNLV